MTRAAILAIGTELTQGQITNRNAAWMSERLTRFGVEVVLHLVVADDHSAIRDGLDLCTGKADLVIVTGGLGPTTDDFTRDVISEWSGRSLVFREASWERIVRRLTQRGIEVAPTNRRQAFFPSESVVLENGVGTADGFRFPHGKAEIIVLPGPPREGMHLWETSLEPWLRERYPGQMPDRLETWKCLGKSESALGEIVESAVAGFPVKTGYRASAPYVEVKIWIPSDLPRERTLGLLARLNAELAPYFVARNEEDLGLKLLDSIREHAGPASITFLDLGSDGILAERLIALLRSQRGREIQARVEVLTRYSETAAPESMPESASDWLFALFPEGRIALVGPPGRQLRALPNPYPNAAGDDLLTDRLRRYRSELALKAWTEMLAASSEAVGE